MFVAAEIQTMPKSKQRGFLISEVWAFGTTPQLYEIWTGHPHHNSTFKCYLLSNFPSLLLGIGDQDFKKWHKYCIPLYNYPFLFQCLKSKLQVPFKFLDFRFQTEKSV